MECFGLGFLSFLERCNSVVNSNIVVLDSLLGFVFTSLVGGRFLSTQLPPAERVLDSQGRLSRLACCASRGQIALELGFTV